MTRQGKVFISYSHPKKEKIQFLLDYLKKTTSDKIEILLDEEGVLQNSNGIINNFINKVDSCDVAILFLSPDYLKKTQDQRDSISVYDEYKKVVSRFLKLKKEGYYDLPTEIGVEKGRKKKTKYFRFFPIMISGTMTDSVPELITKEGIYVHDFSNLIVEKPKKGSQIKSANFKDFKPSFDQIIEEIKKICSGYQEEFERKWQLEFDELFGDTKARWGDKEIFNKYVRAFVKTRVYQKIVNQSAKFLVGRKGSGKSTLADIIPHIHGDSFLGAIRINIDKFPIKSIYELFFNDLNFKSDLQLLSVKERLKDAWEVFILTSFIDLLISLNLSGKLKLSQNVSIRLTKFLCKTLDVEDFSEIIQLQNKQSAYLTSSFEALYSFISKNNQTLGSRPLTSMLIKNDTSKFRKYVFGEEVINDLIEIANENKMNKVFLSFDGFDTDFDLFRREVAGEDDRDERIRFEIYWVWSFIQLILDSGKVESEFKRVFKLFNYCITIPRDRFLEIESRDRDKYRYNHLHFGELQWSGLELCSLLRKRLEILSNYNSAEKTLLKKFEDVCYRKYSTIPFEISFDYNYKKITMPLFSYILRHTFWRPREILWFYAGIIAAAQSEESNNTKLDSDKIREIVKFTTSRVVDNEFIGEFESSFLNIQEVLNKFESKKQLLLFEEIDRILFNVFFLVTNQNIETTVQKVEYLYEIGFLGVKNSTLGVLNKSNKSNSLLEYSFIFTNGFSHIKNLNHNYNNVKFIIHPIFYEKFNINTENNDFMMFYDLEDIRNHESITFDK